jgi:hypothetical protein
MAETRRNGPVVYTDQNAIGWWGPGTLKRLIVGTITGGGVVHLWDALNSSDATKRLARIPVDVQDTGGAVAGVDSIVLDLPFTTGLYISVENTTYITAIFG